MTAPAVRDGNGLPSPVALLDHLDRVNARVASVDELDLGVFRIGRDAVRDWVMRVFPRDRPVAAVEGDAAILDRLVELEFPAEQPIGRMPVSQVAGHPVLITEYVPAVPRDRRRDTIREAGGLRTLGELLGRLAGFEESTGCFARPGGAWHHLAEGHPSKELEAARAILDDVAACESGPKRHLDTVRAALDTADDGAGLP